MKTKYIKIIIALLIFSIIMATIPLNIVNAETEGETGNEENTNFKKIQISLVDSSKPNLILYGDVNCDGIVTTRDRALTLYYSVNQNNNDSITKITQTGLENMKLYSNTTLGISPTVIGRIAIGWHRMIGTNEFNIGDTVSLKAYSNIPSENNNEGYSQIGAGILTGVTWKSSDTSVAEVDSNGNVNFKNNGEVTITATTSDGLYHDYLKLYVGNVNNGIELTGSSILNDSNNVKVSLKIDSSYFEKTMAGYKIKLRQWISNNENEQLLGEATKIESKTSGWTVTEYKIDYDITNEIDYVFIVEADDNYLIQNNNQNIPVILNIELTFPIDFNSDIGGNFFLINEIQGTDYDNEVYELSEITNSYALCMKIVDEKLTVKEGYEDSINIKGNNIYAKIKGYTINDSYSIASQLFGLLENLDKYDSYYIKDYAGNIISEDEKISTGYLVLEKDGQQIQYNLYVIGDICVDTSHCININDVVYLRKAIVGLFDQETPNDFCLNTTDVNDSNVNEDGTRGLGDIGDVIEVRKRIINNKWF